MIGFSWNARIKQLQKHAMTNARIKQLQKHTVTNTRINQLQKHTVTNARFKQLQHKVIKATIDFAESSIQCLVFGQLFAPELRSHMKVHASRRGVRLDLISLVILGL